MKIQIGQQFIMKYIIAIEEINLYVTIRYCNNSYNLKFIDIFTNFRLFI